NELRGEPRRSRLFKLDRANGLGVSLLKRSTFTNAMPVRDRETIRTNVHRSLSRKAGCKSWVPMIHQLRGNNAITYEELEEWKERHRRQVDCAPGYEKEFGKPSRTTATKLCRLLRECKQDPSHVHALTRLRLTKDERRWWDEAAETALVIGICTFLQ